MKKLLLLFICLLILGACFGSGPKPGSVSSYVNGVVWTKGGAFRIGVLSPNWLRQKIKYRALMFVNQSDHATITVDSWCQGAVDDGPLAGLTKEIYKGMEEVNIKSQKKIILSGREALRTEIEGGVDGRRVFMSAVVLKMNTCVFDFVYVSVPGELGSYADFDGLIDGFKYVDGPPVI